MHLSLHTHLLHQISRAALENLKCIWRYWNYTQHAADLAAFHTGKVKIWAFLQGVSICIIYTSGILAASHPVLSFSFQLEILLYGNLSSTLTKCDKNGKHIQEACMICAFIFAHYNIWFQERPTKYKACTIIVPHHKLLLSSPPFPSTTSYSQFIAISLSIAHKTNDVRAET